MWHYRKILHQPGETFRQPGEILLQFGEISSFLKLSRSFLYQMTFTFIKNHHFYLKKNC